MMIFKRFSASLLPLLLIVAVLSGNVQAALLDLGPTVPQVIGSTAPVGHGFPSWYRDTNRVPLEPCMNEAMCFFANPNPPQPVSFPGNIPPELFYWAGDADITLPGVNKKAILVQAIEAGYASGSPVPGEQITFARVRIRIDTDRVGTYVVTTPYKQFTFNVTDIAAGINVTEDIGIALGNFTGALAGSIGPYLYCTDAPFPATDGTGGLYIGKNALACPVLGSTFIPQGESLPANYFRVQGPAGFGGAPSGMVETNQFRVQGKLYTTVTPTPLTVDKATYALDNANMQINVFATTQPLSNQTVAGTFPLNFALGGAPSTLQLSGTGIATQNLTTNTPPDGKFFLASGLFPAPASVPADVTVTNIADSPATVIAAPLVDEVVINAATYNELTKVLSITASSLDRVNAPVLQAFMPGMTAPLGTFANGLMNITFPVIDNTANPSKTYAIPPLNVTVLSSKGGSATLPVGTFINSPPPVATADAATTFAAAPVTIPVLANDTIAAPGVINTATVVISTQSLDGTAAANLDGTVTFTPADGFAGTTTFAYTVKSSSVPPVASNAATVTVTVTKPAPVAVADAASTVVAKAVTIPVLANDTIVAPGVINAASVFISTQSLNGTAVANPAGTVTFTPAAGFTGTTTFAYTVKNNSVPALTSNAATVTVTVNPVFSGLSIILNNGAATTNATLVTATLAATSGAGAVTQMQFSKDGGVTWSSLESFAVTRANISLPAGAGTKTISVRFKDAAGNISAPVSDSIIYDTAVTPVFSGLSIVLNNGAATTKSTLVTATLAATSGAGAVTQMQFSKDGGVTWSSLEPFAATRANISLPAGQGTKTISVRFKVATGSISAPVSDSIIYDNLAPSGTIAVTSSNPTALTTGTLALTATDNVGGSGVTKMQFSTNNGATFFAAETFNATRTVSLPIVGVNNFTVRFIDAAGNVSGNQSVSITRQ